MKKDSLQKNFIYNMLSQIITLLVPLISTPYVSRILHEDGVGQASFSLAMISYFILFASLGFASYGQREIAKYQNEPEKQSVIFHEINISRLFTTILAFVVFVIIFFTSGFGEKYNFLILVSSINLIAVIFDISFYYQGIERFKAIAIRTIILKLIGLIGILLFVKSANDTWIYILCTCLSTFVSNLVMWPSALKRVGFKKIKELNIWHHFLPSFLIFLPTLAVTIYSVLDRTMIGYLAPNPDYANGCYEQAYKINSMALMPMAVIASILIPRNAYDYQHNNINELKDHIYFSSRMVWFLGLPIIAAFIVLSKNLSFWFLGEGYDSVPLLLIIMSLRMIFSGFGTVFGTILFIPIGKEKYSTYATMAGALLNFILNLILIPRYGAVGAALTTALTEFIVTFVLCIFVFKSKIVSLKKCFFMGIKYLISSIIMLIPIYFTQKYLNYSILSFCIISIEGFIIYILCLLIMKEKLLWSVINCILNKLKMFFSMSDNVQLSSPKTAKRNSWIEFLRIISIIGIVICHASYYGGIAENSNGILQYVAVAFLPLGKIFFCVFAFISSWYLIGKNMKFAHTLKLWIQTLLYNLVLLILAITIFKYKASTTEIIKSFLPIFGFGVSHGYISGYLLFILFLPFINYLVNQIKSRNVFCLLILIFTINMFCSITQINNVVTELFAFMLIYLVAFFLRKIYSTGKKINIKILAMIVLISYLLSYLSYLLVYVQNNRIGNLIMRILCIDERSPLNLIAASSLFMFFIYLKPINNKIINFLAKPTLDILLLHDSGIFRKIVWLNIFSSLNFANNNFYWWIFIVVIILYFSGMLLFLIRHFTIDKIIDKTSSITNLCCFVDELNSDIAQKNNAAI